MQAQTPGEKEAYQKGEAIGAKSPDCSGFLRNPYPEKTRLHTLWGLGWCKGFSEAP